MRSFALDEEMPKDQKLFLEPLGLHVHYVSYGNTGPEAKKVLGFHGWLDNAATFEALSPYLKGIHLMSFDLIGHGKSDHIGIGGSYNLVDYSLTILYIADALGIPKANILAHSMGAAMSGLLACTMPHRIEKAILIEAMLPYPHPDEQILERIPSAYQINKNLDLNHPSRFDSIGQMIKLRQKATPLDAKLLRPLVERSAVKTDKGYRWSFDQRLKQRSIIGISKAQETLLLRNLSVPILSLCATKGLEFARDQVKIAQSDSPKYVTAIELEGGHHVHMESPEEVATLAADFFS